MWRHSPLGMGSEFQPCERRPSRSLCRPARELPAIARETGQNRPESVRICASPRQCQATVSEFPELLQISRYRTEKPANSSYLVCADVTGQKDRWRARSLRGLPVDRSGTRGYDRRFCVMEMALKHKYNVGETVYFTASNVARPAASGTYEVIRLLPTDGDDCQYRIKNSTEAFERVAKESQLNIS